MTHIDQCGEYLRVTFMRRQLHTSRTPYLYSATRDACGDLRSFFQARDVAFSYAREVWSNGLGCMFKSHQHSDWSSISGGSSLAVLCAQFP